MGGAGIVVVWVKNEYWFSQNWRKEKTFPLRDTFIFQNLISASLVKVFSAL